MSLTSQFSCSWFSWFNKWQTQFVEIIIIPVLDLCLLLGASQGASPARHPPAAGKPSVCGPEPGSQRYGGLVQEFFRNVCSSRAQGGVALPGERTQKDSLGGLAILASVDEPKPECVSAGVGALTGMGGSNDNVTRIVNKRFMRQTAGEEMVSIMGGGKETTSSGGAVGPGLEVRPLRMHFYFEFRPLELTLKAFSTILIQFRGHRCLCIN